MDFSAIFQFRNKKYWWMDVIFYFVISLLIATVFCYVIFLVKNSMQRQDIQNEIVKLQSVGTEQQKGYEKSVISYQKRIADFTSILKDHQFASNVFALLQTQTMTNVWFKQFSLDEKNTSVQLNGEADSLETVSRQVANFEKNKYIPNVKTLSAALAESGNIQFDLSLGLSKDVFSYLSDMAAIIQPAPQSTTDTTDQNNSESSSAAAQENTSNQKLITAFHLMLNPEVIGTINQSNYTITLGVPDGTDIKNLKTSIVISPGATVSPTSDTPKDFTTPVFYRVTAQDKSTQDYKVTVNILPKEVAQAKSGGGILWIILSVVIVLVIAGAAVAAWFVWKKKQKKNQI